MSFYSHMIIVTDRLAFLQLNRGSLPAIQEVGGTSLRIIAMRNPQPPGLKSTFRSSIAFCDSQHECARKKGIFDTCLLDYNYHCRLWLVSLPCCLNKPSTQYMCLLFLCRKFGER